MTPHLNGGWQVKGAGNSKTTIRTDTQARAIAIAIETAHNQKAELFIHRTNSRIREKDSYGTLRIRRKV